MATTPVKAVPEAALTGVGVTVSGGAGGADAASAYSPTLVSRAVSVPATGSTPHPEHGSWFTHAVPLHQ